MLEMLKNKAKVMGFGHAIYRESDPRNAIIKRWAKRLSEDAGDKVLYAVSERVDEVMWREKNLFPNADFYHASGRITLWAFRRNCLRPYSSARESAAGQHMSWSSARTTALFAPVRITRALKHPNGWRWTNVAKAPLNESEPCDRLDKNVRIRGAQPSRASEFAVLCNAAALHCDSDRAGSRIVRSYPHQPASG